MRFRTIRARGFATFSDEVEVNFDQLPGPLVAVCGDNGSGKSTLLELLVGAIYRRCPTRGRLSDLATQRDSLVEVCLTNGSPWTLRQRVDATSGKGEAEVLDADGAPVLSAAKLREADAWVSAHLPDPSVVFSSVFGAQGSQGFLDLDPTERKRVVLSVLGHERLEAMSKAAGERARAAKAEHDTCLARLADEVERGGDVGVLEVAVGVALKRCKTLAAEVTRHEKDLAAAREASAAWQHQTDARAAASTRLRELDAHAAKLAGEIASVEERRTNNAGLLERAPAIRKAAAELAGLEQPIATAEARLATAEAKAKESTQEAAHASREAERLRSQLHEAAQRVEQLQAQLAKRDALQAEADALAEREAVWSRATKDFHAAQEETARCRRLELEGKDQRIAGLRDGLQEVSALGDIPQVAARTALRHLDEDEALREEMARGPELVRRAAAAERKANGEAHEAEAAVSRAKEAVAALTQLATVAEELATTERRRASWLEAYEAAQKRGREATWAATEAKEAAEAARRDVAELHDLRRTCQKEAARLPQLEAAEARIEELDDRLAKLRPERERVAKEAEALTLPDNPGAKPDVEHRERGLEAARQDQAEAERQLARAEEALSRAKASAERIKGLEAERVRIEEELADWRLLEQDLGRNGVQALELDAAGPELTEMANDLLRCWGTRFSVRIDSSRSSADGKKTIEGCWVYVYDVQANREAEAKTFSGGERVLIGEAVNLAIAMLGVRHAGLTQPTLVRDETGAALSADNGVAYVAMLRRAADLIGADKVLFVSHDPALQELADARLLVGGGKIEVSP